MFFFQVPTTCHLLGHAFVANHIARSKSSQPHGRDPDDLPRSQVALSMPSMQTSRLCPRNGVVRFYEIETFAAASCGPLFLGSIVASEKGVHPNSCDTDYSRT